MSPATATARQPLYRALADELRDGIMANGRQALRLPTEKELSAAHGVSVITVRKALDILTAEDLIVRTPRRGTLPPSPPVA